MDGLNYRAGICGVLRMQGTMPVKRGLRLWVAIGFTFAAFGTGAVLLFLNSARAPRFLPALIFFACPALHLALFGARDTERPGKAAIQGKFAEQ
jgi:hypothetical protein